MPPTDAAPFAKVLCEELEDIKRRRDPPVNPPKRDSHPEKSLQDLRREALGLDLVGLALSGGGIRSATFCLGVLQGLAQLGLLKRIDYLSTVSGGGYIGGWLAAWIKREGDVENVEKQLKPDRREQAKAKRLFESGGRVLDEEAEPVRHLRAYSNYLAPRPSLFSADGWVLIAIYLRNLLLNQLVFLLISLALVVGVCAVVQLAAVVTYGPDIQALVAQGSPEAGAATQEGGVRSWGWYALFYGLIAAAFLVACRGIYQSTSQIAGGEEPDAGGRKTSPSVRTGIRRFWTWILAPFMAGAFFATLFSLYHFGPIPGEKEGWNADRLNDLGTVALFFAALHGLLQVPSVELHRLLRRFRKGENSGAASAPGWVWPAASYLFRIAFGAVIGGLGGSLLYAAIYLLHSATNSYDAPPDSAAAVLSSLWVPFILTLGPPVLLGVMVLMGFLQTGLLGDCLSEAQREWRSSLAGYLLALAGGWLALFGVVLFGPYLVLRLAETWSFWGPSLLAAAWSALVGGGLLAALNAPPDQNRTARDWKSMFAEVLARMAPGVFLAGVLVLTVLLSVWVLSGFQLSREHYVERIDHTQYPTYLHRWAWEATPSLGEAWGKLGVQALGGGALVGLAALLSWRFNINLFSMNGLYANRLVRCYLGASRPKPAHKASDRPPGAAMNSYGPPRDPNALTGFDPRDDLELRELQTGRERRAPKKDDKDRDYWGPIPLICTALNLVQGEELAWQERKAESFVLTPRYCGGETVDYRPTREYAGGLLLGEAMSISGAAVSPNWGFYSTPAVGALLTLFNARLGAWLGNPKQATWKHASPRFGLLYLFAEMLGRTNDRSKYVYLSDGGHFEDLGVYELVRRRCRFIVCCDAGADPDFNLQDLGNLIRKVRIDFGVRIDIDVSALRPRGDDRHCGSHVAIGKIRYGDVDLPDGAEAAADADPLFRPQGDEGLFVYIKAGLTGDEPSDLLNYVAQHPNFPHHTTVDQFFTESEFESYRALGYHSALAALGDAVADCARRQLRSNRDLFTTLYDLWYPPPPDFTETYLKSNTEYMAVQEALRTDPQMRFLSAELSPADERNVALLQDPEKRRTAEVRNAERRMVLQMLTVLEDAWFGLHLDRYRSHPVHNGWMEVYQRWLKAPTVRAEWPDLRKEFSQVFQKVAEDLAPELRNHPS